MAKYVPARNKMSLKGQPLESILSRRRGMLSPLWDINNFFDSFDETFSQIFSEVFEDQRRFKDIAKSKSSYPKTDVIAEKSKIIFRMAVPGLQKDDIDISLGDELLTVKYQKREKKEVEPTRYYNEEESFLSKEIKHTSFSRSWAIPQIDNGKIDEISSNLKDGILEVSIPILEEEKKEEEKVKKILINDSS